MNLSSVLQHESHRPVRFNDLCCRPAVGRETDIHRLDVLRRPLVSPGGVEVNGEVDHTVVMRRNPTESLAVKRAQNRLRRLCLRPQFQERRLLGREADAVRLSGYLSLRSFQSTQPVSQAHSSAPIVPAAARNQQPQRRAAAPCPGSRVCCRAWGLSSRLEYLPWFRPAFALHPRPILGRRRYARRRRTPCGCEHRLCARVPRLARGRRAASQKALPLRTGAAHGRPAFVFACHLPLGTVLAAWVIPPSRNWLSLALKHWRCEFLQAVGTVNRAPAAALTPKFRSLAWIRVQRAVLPPRSGARTTLASVPFLLLT